MPISEVKLLDTLNQLIPLREMLEHSERAVGYKAALEEVMERVRSGTLYEDAVPEVRDDKNSQVGEEQNVE